MNSLKLCIGERRTVYVLAINSPKSLTIILDIQNVHFALGICEAKPPGFMSLRLWFFLRYLHITQIFHGHRGDIVANPVSTARSLDKYRHPHPHIYSMVLATHFTATYSMSNES